MSIMIVMHERSEKNAVRELSELLDAVESVVRIACLVEDSALAEEVVRGMLKNSKVLGVVIRTTGRELARSYRIYNIATNATKPNVDRFLVRSIAAPLSSAQIVGEIMLELDFGTISERVAEDVQFFRQLFILLWIVLSGGLLVLVFMVFVQPIKIISDSLDLINNENCEQLTPPVGHEKTEIGRLVSNINVLLARLVAGFNHVTEQTKQIRDAKYQFDTQSLQLEVKNLALRRAMKNREEVERIARHDLRTPINSIATIPALLRKNWRPSEDEEVLLSMIEKSARRVLRMVNLSLDLFCMEEGNYCFRPKSVDILALMHVVTLDLAEEARGKALVVQIDAFEQQVLVRAEEILCYSILANILKNAIEAAPHHTIIRITVLVCNPVVLSIHNEGSVPGPVRASFFDKYATYGKNQGTGLGTYSALLMARAQQGDLTMETYDEVGTTLKLELLPDRRHASRDVPAIDVAPHASLKVFANETVLPALRILLVDDDPDNVLIMKLFLPSPPLEVETACNGLVAVEACKLRRPDVIFMDIEMPVMGGFDALRQIRTLQANRGEVPSKIIAFSAHDDEASRLRGLSSGFDYQLSKPSSQREILTFLSEIQTGFFSDSGQVQPDPLPEMNVWVDHDVFEAIPGFLESRRALITALRQALMARHEESARQLAHKLKGSFGMYEFRWAAQICLRLEDIDIKLDSNFFLLQVDLLEKHLTDVKVHSRPSR